MPTRLGLTCNRRHITHSLPFSNDENKYRRGKLTFIGHIPFQRDVKHEDLPLHELVPAILYFIGQNIVRVEGFPSVYCHVILSDCGVPWLR